MLCVVFLIERRKIYPKTAPSVKSLFRFFVIFIRIDINSFVAEDKMRIKDRLKERFEQKL